ncbi:MAG: twitching motility protein PilT [Clostridia bacterium]|nr:twitching motility protein PilT [Clostridia bacterium]
MIQIIAGLKGSGKTKRLIDLTNKTARESAGDVIFLDDDNRYMFDVDHKVRFINAEDYHINNADMFIGFLCGMLSSNFDISTIFIDAFLKLSHTPLEESEAILNTLNALTVKHGVNFVLSLSADPETLPAFMKGYLV